MALPVAELADKDCALFLWITLPKLCEAWGVMEAWGFTYRTTAFVWIKLNPRAGTVFWGPGSWTHANAELCLLATKGHPKRQARNIHQLIISNREEHSKKPEEARRRIEALMGDLLNTPPETVPLDRTNGAARPLKWCMVTADMVH